jgi:hypothetical protein
MMYNQKLVASIKANGKVLREFKDTVYIPFGSEYSFLIKNLNTQRAVVNVFIDGENVVPGRLVIDPGRTVDLERWIKNGNLSEGNKFKFIERTQAIEDGPRGIKLEDGLVRVEYQFELPRPVPSPFWVSASGSSTPYYPPGVRNINASYNVGGMLRSVDMSANGATVQAQASAAIDQYCADNGIKTTSEIHDGMATMDWCANEVGITVPGSKSEQKFVETTIGTLESTIHNIVLKLVGDLGNNKPVQKAVTVKAKPKCVTCGHQNKATSKFCTECGTALEIFA